MIKSLASILILSFSIYSEGRPLQEPNRSLQTDDAVVVVENIENEFKVKVKVRQTVVGTPATCGKGRLAQAADALFMVYVDPVTDVRTCKIFKNADACFEQEIEIGCDKYRNVAEMQLYTRDVTFATSLQVQNPRVGRCYGNTDMISKTMYKTFSFPCLLNIQGQQCQYDSDCPSDYYCSSLGCNAYAKVGEKCGYYDLRNWNVCDPKTSFCNEPMSCLGKSGGICEAYGGGCATSSDCRVDQYCNTRLSKCMPRLRKQGECCTDHILQCKQGTTCKGKTVNSTNKKMCA